jgi:hypothetical protein
MQLQKLKLLFALSAILLVPSVSNAIPIVGSLPLNGAMVSQNGTDLSNSTMIIALNLLNLSLGTGNYSFIPMNTSFGPATLNYTSMATLALFSFTSPTGFGSFQATANPQNAIITKTASFLDVFIIGTFTPGPAWPAGFDPSAASLRFSVNQSGLSISEAITLNSPPVPPVPEPSTLVLIGGALVGVALIARRRVTA